jgi:hypothetical protein
MRRNSPISAMLPAILFVVLTVYSCQQKPTPEIAKKPEHTFTVKGSVREMNIWPETPEFPEHAGKAEFVSYCGICHSLKYITAQPDFPRVTWEHEIKKMVEKYGAPIDSATCLRIEDYLVAIKGSK